MSPHLLRGRSPVFLVLKLIALLLIAFSVATVPGLSDAPARANPRDVGLSVGIVLVLFLASHWLLPPGVDKVLTIAGVVVGLFIPGVFLSFHLATQWENSWRDREVHTFVREVTAPGHARELALYLRDPLASPAPQLTGEHLERLEQRLLKAPPEELRQYHLVECLLMGLEPIPANDVQPLENQEPLSRLYVKLKARAELSWEEAPFYLQQRDRVVSRIAEVGFAPWKQEVDAESPLFAQVVHYNTLYPFIIDETLPKTLAPGTRLESRTLGSFSMHVLMVLSRRIFPAPPGLKPAAQGDDGTQTVLKDTREALAVVRSRGLDFTQEERALPGLTEFLERVRTANPPP